VIAAIEGRHRPPSISRRAAAASGGKSFKMMSIDVHTIAE
jgi:hypothetical protein